MPTLNDASPGPHRSGRKPFYKNLTFQVLVAVAIGVVIGRKYPNERYPDVIAAFKALGDGFINLVKMVVGPIIFLTIVLGIVKMGDMKKVGRVGFKAIIYFEIITTLAMVIGLFVANGLKPGAGIDTSKADMKAIEKYVQAGHDQSIRGFLLGIIPDNVVGAFASGNLLQIVFFSLLFGTAMALLGGKESRLVAVMEDIVEVMFKIVAIIMRAAPLGALGAMTFTIGTFGIEALVSLAKLMACVYTTMALFIFVVLGLMCRMFGFRLWPFLKFIREEILLALGTSSSESVLPRMIERLEMCGCGRAVVGLVIPAGYSFNMDGTSIYLSMAVVFIAQAFGVQMDIWHQLYLLAVLMLTSKGSAGVTGAGFITLAATFSATNTGLPLIGLALLVGVDRFMSEARTITNLIGNGVATIVVSKMEGEFDEKMFKAAMSGKPLRAREPVEVKADLMSVR